MPFPLINCIVTADYEIFLGRNFLSNEEVLFKPTRQMMDVCGELNTPITFFADVCSVWAHRRYGLNDYAHSFENQLHTAVREGHDVQLHLHPHWLKSTFENGEWHISTEQMYLWELEHGDGGDSAAAVIKQGVEYLNKLLQKEKPSYRCIAFRAAGLALQPGEHELIAALLESGIQVDSSVGKNVRLKMDTIELDYTGMPTDANWFMDPQKGICTSAERGLFEIPVATFQSDWRSRVGFLWRRALSIKMQRGVGISRARRQTRLSTLKSMLQYNWRYVSTNPWFLLSCDTKGFSLKMLLSGFDNYIKRHSHVDSIYVSMINHPKMMFAPQFELLRAWVTEVRDRYGERIRFVTYNEAAEQINRKT